MGGWQLLLRSWWGWYPICLQWWCSLASDPVTYLHGVAACQLASFHPTTVCQQLILLQQLGVFFWQGQGTIIVLGWFLVLVCMHFKGLQYNNNNNNTACYCLGNTTKNKKFKFLLLLSNGINTTAFYWDWRIYQECKIPAWLYSKCFLWMCTSVFLEWICKIQLGVCMSGHSGVAINHDSNNILVGSLVERLIRSILFNEQWNCPRPNTILLRVVWRWLV